MFFFLSKVLDVFLAPLTWSLVLWLTMLGLTAWRPQRRRPALTLGALGLGNLLFFSQPTVANALERSLEDRQSTMRPEVTYDAVVLMGGVVDTRAEQPEGRRSYNDNVERLLATFDVLRTGRARVAIISGGDPDASRPEAAEAPTQRDQLIEWGIDPSRIIVESTARNTRENAIEVKKATERYGWKDVLVVTSAFHMARALGCFHAVGMDVDSLVVDRRAAGPQRGASVLPRVEALYVSSHALRELAGRLIYRVRGYST